ncbi:unnamed protein product [Microthlaspi erraticum]|uniref:PGG domain-containing protein n=1 Tax=Microthlaspi erraticum TaxID=1685480 RepID=A0A6D2KSX0_9BRAS|nr:unnamed protein product [Microthlaspi erraticum]
MKIIPLMYIALAMLLTSYLAPTPTHGFTFDTRDGLVANLLYMPINDMIAVICLLATIAVVSAHEGHVHSHSPAPAPGPASSAVVSATNMFTGLAFAAVALVVGLNH